MFLSCGNACTENYRRFSGECSNAGRETRVQQAPARRREGLVRHRRRAAKDQRSTWKPISLPRPSVSLCARTHCHRGTHNPEHKHWTGPREVCCRSKRRRKMGVRTWLGRRKRKVGVTEEGVYHSAINTRHGNRGRGGDNEAVSQTRLHPTWTKRCCMTIPSYAAQRWTPCVYTWWRLIPASESAIHKNNKALRLKSTKRRDSLNKSYCWQQAAPCVCVCARVYVSSVCWTHFRCERKCWQRVFIFLFEIYTSHHSRGRGPLGVRVLRSSVSVCLCVCVSEKERKRGSVCMSTYWVIYGECLAKKDKSGERQSGIMYLRVFLCFPTRQIVVEWIFSLALPSSSPRSQLNQAAIQEYWDEAPRC